MRIQFQSLAYQELAVQSALDIFKGIEENSAGLQIALAGREGTLRQTEFGFGNSLPLNRTSIYENLRKVQVKNDLEVTPESRFEVNGLRFTIEMETGTGKTFVYLQTILRLHKVYGWTKFIIVVPSVAIREGVLQSLKMLSPYFRLEEGVPLEHGSSYQLYQGSRPTDLRNFALSPSLQILVMNIQAFNSENAIIRKELESFQGNRPLDYILETKPILLIDEPQKVDSSDSGKGKEALASLNPLFQLRYSATHKEDYNKIFRLGPVEAFQEKLVKAIQVRDLQVTGFENHPYMKLIKVDRSKTGSFSAQLELNVYELTNVKKKKVTVRTGDRLFDKTGNNSLYENYIVASGISTEPGNELVPFTNGLELKLGEALGGMTDVILEERIRETILAHFEKEKTLKEKGIQAKVLSLFFIDRVANYKQWDDQGNEIQGKYFQMFIKHYENIVNNPKFESLLKFPVDKVQNGYFSGDKGKKWKDTGGETKDDEKVYDLIMKDKERLLDTNEPLRFIFSHSALQEGWDNPNVFQICTLLEASSETRKRQQIGRGLRLPVDSEGRRIHDEIVNKLTVIASESYDSFVKGLQKEYQEDGIEFGKLNIPQIKRFISRKFPSEQNFDSVSNDLFQSMITNGYLTTDGNFTNQLEDILHSARASLNLGPAFAGKEEVIKSWLSGLNIQNFIRKKEDPIPWKRTKDKYKNEEFLKLWDLVRQKTFYQFTLDQNRLIEQCVQKLHNIQCKPPEVIVTISDINHSVGGLAGNVIRTNEGEERSVGILTHSIPDPVRFLQSKTDLTRDTLKEILLKAGSLDQFVNNPSEYLRLATLRIQETIRNMVVPGIEYVPIPGEYWNQTQIFEEQLETFKDRLVDVPIKGLFERMPCDSKAELSYAKRLETTEKVIVFTKTPPKFRIPTPLGEYNPDWMVVENDNISGRPILRFFIKETKGFKDIQSIPKDERQKIKSANRHFDVLVDTYKKRLLASGMPESEIPEFTFQLVIGEGEGNSQFQEISYLNHIDD